MTSVTTTVPNAIVFVLDPHNKHITVPGYEPGRVSASNSSCISVATLPEVDGEVTLRLCEHSNDSGGQGLVQVFDGSIEIPGKKLVIVTSHNERVLEANVPGPLTRVTVSVDDPSGPGLVHVVTR